jgi:hypothetical protein
LPGGGERRVDLVLPGLRAERVDQDELAVRTDDPAQLADLGGVVLARFGGTDRVAGRGRVGGPGEPGGQGAQHGNELGRVQDR